MSIIKLAALFLVLLGCSKNITIDVTKLPSSFLLIFHENGVEQSETEISKGIKVYDAMNDWLLRNENGWQKSYITYAPDIMLRSEFMNINLVNKSNLIVVNFKSKDEWMQVVKVAPEKLLDNFNSKNNLKN